jgi:hypothetical protein
MYRHAVVITPMARWVLIARGPAYSSLASHRQRRWPSPLSCRVGAHIRHFEACSTFSRVIRLRRIGSLHRQAIHLSRRLRRFCHLHRRSDPPKADRLERPSCRVGITPTEDRRLCTAHNLGTTLVRERSVRANWVRAASGITELLGQQRHDQSMRLTLDELFERLGGDTEPGDFRTRSFWASEQRGDESFTAFRDAGLALGFEPDETGVPVERVTFRLDQHRGLPPRW